MRFTKMEGCGNDYVYIDGFLENIEGLDVHKLAIAVSNRHFGIGSDGLVLILPSDAADLRMRMFNADGSESPMCGNAARCVGKYAYERGLTDKTELLLETGAGIRKLQLKTDNTKVTAVTVDMGSPVFEGNKTLLAEDREFSLTCVSMGNPHAVTFLSEPVTGFPVDIYGPKLENAPVFPNRSNIEFVRVLDRSSIEMRVWERGSGETLACGTGACAAAAAVIAAGFCERRVRVSLPGGTLFVYWDETDGHIYMTGPAVICFDGIWHGSKA